MLTSKRKGADISSPSAVSAVRVDDNRTTTTQPSWEETAQLLKDMRLKLQDDDDVMNSLDKCFELSASLENEQQLVLEESDKIKSDLEDRIQQEREAYREESDELYQAQLKLQKSKAEKETLQQTLEEMDAKEHEMRERIIGYIEEAAQEVEFEAEQINQRKKLKYLKYYYRQTTEIKWDHEQEPLLAGEIVLPNQQGTRRFCIDPREHSNFDIANHLWGLKDGETSPLIPSED